MTTEAASRVASPATPAVPMDVPLPLVQTVDQAIERALRNLEVLQAERGSWPGDYGGPMFLLPMYVALAYVARRLPPPERIARLVTYFSNVQRSDGSIGLHAEATSGSMFTTALGYVALRLLGVAADDGRLVRMRRWIHENGTPLASASWGKLILCVLGLYDWRGIHPVLPELWLLPKDAPMHPGRLWCHARQVYLPMAWLYGMRSTAPMDPLLSAIRDELYRGEYDRIHWQEHRDTVAHVDAYRPSTWGLKAANRAQGVFEGLTWNPLRKKALDECLHHIRYEDSVTSDFDIGPVNAILNMLVHHFRGPEGAADFERGWPKFDGAYLWDGHDGLKMQGYNNSELWDTAFAVQAVLAAVDAKRVTADAMGRVLERAHGYIRDNQILDDVPDAEAHYRHQSKGGWPFSNRAHGWPITDCTAEGLKCALALEGRFEPGVPVELLRETVRLIMSLQNDDGGWASYEKTRGGAWLEQLNPSQIFGDIMIDTSFVECTSSCLQALAKARHRFPGDTEIAVASSKGADFLRRQQRQDGSFEGNWAVCFTYGTWFAVSGLLAAGVPKDALSVRRAVAFLLSKQRADGSWSEHGDTCRERRWIEGPDGLAAQTAWALSALVRAGCQASEALDRAAAWLCARQQPDGAWPREPLVGVFNRTCLINYDNYRHVFPLWALAEWRAARG